MIQIHWTILVYAIPALCSLLALIHNYFSSYGGGLWAGGKRRYELDFVGYFNVVFLIVWTLMWGGKFWW